MSEKHCLHCGYSLKGHCGDPITCPECGTTNSLYDLTFVRLACSRTGRRAATALALVPGGALLAVLSAVLLPVSGRAWVLMMTGLIISAAGAWLLRKMRGRHLPIVLIARYSGCLLGVLGLAVLLVVCWSQVILWIAGLHTWALFATGGSALATCALTPFGIAAVIRLNRAWSRYWERTMEDLLTGSLRGRGDSGV